MEEAENFYIEDPNSNRKLVFSIKFNSSYQSTTPQIVVYLIIPKDSQTLWMCLICRIDAEEWGYSMFGKYKSFCVGFPIDIQNPQNESFVNPRDEVGFLTPFSAFDIQKIKMKTITLCNWF